MDADGEPIYGLRKRNYTIKQNRFCFFTKRKVEASEYAGAMAEVFLSGRSCHLPVLTNDSFGWLDISAREVTLSKNF